MTLEPIEIDFESVAIPMEIEDFLGNVANDVEEHRVDTAKTFQGFVPSNYRSVYQCLKAIVDQRLLSGERFCEWGSGIGVVSSLAAMLGPESYGIEYQRDLCAVAEKISDEYEIPVDIINGSFIPTDSEKLVEAAFAEYDGELSLLTEPGDAYEEIDLAVSDFDLIFSYPWPNDFELICKLFECNASVGALLLVFDTQDGMSLFRKVEAKKKSEGNPSLVRH